MDQERIRCMDSGEYYARLRKFIERKSGFKGDKLKDLSFLVNLILQNEKFVESSCYHGRADFSFTLERLEERVSDVIKNEKYLDNFQAVSSFVQDKLGTRYLDSARSCFGSLCAYVFVKKLTMDYKRISFDGFLDKVCEVESEFSALRDRSSSYGEVLFAAIYRGDNLISSSGSTCSDLVKYKVLDGICDKIMSRWRRQSFDDVYDAVFTRGGFDFIRNTEKDKFGSFVQLETLCSDIVINDVEYEYLRYYFIKYLKIKDQIKGDKLLDKGVLRGMLEDEGIVWKENSNYRIKLREFDSLLNEALKIESINLDFNCAVSSESLLLGDFGCFKFELDDFVKQAKSVSYGKVQVDSCVFRGILGEEFKKYGVSDSFIDFKVGIIVSELYDRGLIKINGSVGKGEYYFDYGEKFIRELGESCGKKRFNVNKNRVVEVIRGELKYVEFGKKMSSLKASIFLEQYFRTDSGKVEFDLDSMYVKLKEFRKQLFNLEILDVFLLDYNKPIEEFIREKSCRLNDLDFRRSGELIFLGYELGRRFYDQLHKDIADNGGVLLLTKENKTKLTDLFEVSLDKVAEFEFNLDEFDCVVSSLANKLSSLYCFSGRDFYAFESLQGYKSFLKYTGISCKKQGGMIGLNVLKLDRLVEGFNNPKRYSKRRVEKDVDAVSIDLSDRDNKIRTLEKKGVIELKGNQYQVVEIIYKYQLENMRRGYEFNVMDSRKDYSEKQIIGRLGVGLSIGEIGRNISKLKKEGIIELRERSGYFGFKRERYYKVKEREFRTWLNEL